MGLKANQLGTVAILRQKVLIPATPDDYPFLSPPCQPDEIGRLGDYRVLRLLGKGGMGFVFHAEDATLRRPVALKVMKPDMEGQARGCERFLREARAMASIKHDSLVTVFQVGHERNVVYLAMELLDGDSLEDWIEKSRRPKLSTVVRIAREIAEGLAAIHSAGLVHRDLKPANLWMEPNGRVKILDFGLARFVNDNDGLTQSGAILGTPSFMSPEQARGRPVDFRSDLFSLGCVLYNLCTGKSPFHSNNVTAALTALAVDTPTPLRERNAAIPEELSELVEQLLVKDPSRRPASAAEIAERLLQIERRLVDRPRKRDAASKADVAEARKSSAEATAVIGGGDAPSGNNREAVWTPPIESGPPRAVEKSRSWGGIVVALALAVAAGSAATWFAFDRFRGIAANDRTGVKAESPPKKESVGPPKTESTKSVAATQVASDASPKLAAVFLTSFQPPPVGKNVGFRPPPPPGQPPIASLSGVRVRGVEKPNGIFMHPMPFAQEPVSLTYELGGKFRTLDGVVSLNDGPFESESPITFVVRGDGRVVWQSKPVKSQRDEQAFTVSVVGVDRLTIEAGVDGRPEGAHAVWIDPLLTP
jgi:serine/threonine protein kinase